MQQYSNYNKMKTTTAAWKNGKCMHNNDDNDVDDDDDDNSNSNNYNNIYE